MIKTFLTICGMVILGMMALIIVSFGVAMVVRIIKYAIKDE